MQTEKMTSQVLLNSDYDDVIKIPFDEYKYVDEVEQSQNYFYFSYQLEVNFIQGAKMHKQTELGTKAAVLLHQQNCSQLFQYKKQIEYV